jgi:hypothetical protein
MMIKLNWFTTESFFESLRSVAWLLLSNNSLFENIAETCSSYEHKNKNKNIMFQIMYNVYP